MKRGRISIKRTLSLLMALAMVLSMIPFTAFAAENTITVYFTNNKGWSKVNAYYWGAGSCSWPGNEMTYEETNQYDEKIYSVTVPKGITGLIFNNGSEQTVDITQNLTHMKGFYLDVKSNNKWTVGSYDYTPAYSVAGTSGLCGSDWNPEDKANLMTLNEATGLYEKTFKNVAAGSYEFKVTNGSWKTAWGNNGNNYAVTVSEDGSSVTITFNASSKEISVQVTAPVKYQITFKGTNVSSDGAAQVTQGNAYTANLTAEEGYDLPETVSVTAGGKDVAHTFENGVLTIPADVITGDLVITAAGVAQNGSTETPVEPEPTSALVYFCDNKGWGTAYAYAWDADGNRLLGDWPGTQMAHVFIDGYGQSVYGVELPAGVSGLIFTNNSGEQTVDIAPGFQDSTGFYLTDKNTEGKWDVNTYAYEGPALEKPELVTKVTIHFRNTGMWNDVHYHAWIENGSADEGLTQWPGVKLAENPDHPNWYTLELTGLNAPKGVGILFSNNGSSQTADLLLAKDGGEYWYDNQLLTEAPDTWADGSVETVTYDVTLHFANTKNWGNVNLYTWNAVGLPTGAWPGTAAGLDGSGFYTVNFTYEAPEGQSLGFIFNGGGQTVDLNLDASAFRKNGDVYRAEKWVCPTTPDAEGKFYADVVDAAEAIAVSPVVNGNSVTFQYKGNATDKVSLHIKDKDWAGIAMTPNQYGVFSLTLDDLSYGIHEYKFTVNDVWIADPLNTWHVGNDQNSAFLISDPNLDENKVFIKVHYSNTPEWNVCAWGAAGLKPQYNFNSGVATIELDGRANQYVAFKVRKSVAGNDWAEQSGEIRVDLGSIVSGTIDIWVNGDFSWSQSLNDNVVYANKISSVELDYDNNTIVVQTTQMVADPETAFSIWKNKTEQADIIQSISATGSRYTLKLKQTMDLATLYQYTLRFAEQVKFTDHDYIVGINTVYASKKFGDEFTYTGADLGANWAEDATKFVVWAPTAEAVSVNLYTSGTDKTDDLEKTIPMTKGEKGVWSVTEAGNLNGKYYTYTVTVDGKDVESIDPYARTAGVNGKRGMVIDLDSTDPDGWAQDKNPNPSTSYNDAIIYELHVRDFSIDDSSGIMDAYQGKYLAFTQTGTTVDADENGTGDGEIPSGIDYLKSMGFTHLHLLPVYDYGSVDETKCENFNWGYDPVNYNVPEGSYSTDPDNGAVRVNEFKQMVKSLHDNGISVIMDVVYNHVYDAGQFSVNKIVPSYFSRVNADGSFSNGSGCGNDTASEREMVRKYIVESVMYWKEEYHIDGFRFDLVGLLDETTINEIVNTVHAKYPDVIFYGEGWTLGTAVEPGNDMATQANASGTPDFAYFSDTIRNLLAGSNGTSLGFVSGAQDQEGKVKDSFMAMPGWTSDPSQIVQYVSCHDNYTLVDKLILSTGKSGIDSEIIKMNNLAAAIYMTSQGIPFIHAGEEFLREKIDPNSHTGRCENSYNAPDSVNHIEWSNLANATYMANSDYYKGLIEFRKAHSALRMTENEDIQKYISYTWVTDEVMRFDIDAAAAGDASDGIVVIFNASKSSKTVGLPDGTWSICIDQDQAGIEAQGSAVSGSVEVAGISAMVLVKGELAHTEGEPTEKNRVEATCTTDGGYDTVVCCTTCGEEVSRVHTVIPAGHVDNNNDHLCDREKCAEKISECVDKDPGDGKCDICEAYLAEIHGIQMADPSSSLGLAFQFSQEKVEHAAYVKITHTYANGDEPDVVIVPREQWEPNGETYTVSYDNIAAKEMQDRITVDFYSANDTILNVQGEFGYTYLDQIIQALEASDSPAEKTMYADLIFYGLAAQDYFGYGSGLTAEDLSEYQQYATAAVTGKDTRKKKTGYAGSSATLGNMLELNFIFKKSTVGNVANVQAVITHADGTVTYLAGEDFLEYSSDYWYIPVVCESLGDMGKDVKVYIYKNTDENHTKPVTYAVDSLTSYAWRAGDSHEMYQCMLKLAASAAVLEKAQN